MSERGEFMSFRNQIDWDDQDEHLSEGQENSSTKTLSDRTKSQSVNLENMKTKADSACWSWAKTKTQVKDRFL